MAIAWARMLLSAALVGSGAWLTSAPAIAAEQATIVEILDGNQVFINNRQVPINSRASRNQLVRTGDSRTQLRFSDQAIGRLGQQSVIKIGSRCFQISRGQILISGPQDGCTKSARLSVRGTNYVVEVTADGATNISVLEGQVAVTTFQGQAGTAGADTNPDPALITDPNLKEPGDPTIQIPGSDSPSGQIPVPNMPAGDASLTTDPSLTEAGDPIETFPENEGKTVVLQAGQQLQLSPEGVLLTILQLTAGDFAGFLQGQLFSGYQEPLPGLSNILNQYQILFPGVGLPGIPGIPVPSVPSIPFFF
ncbi:FecR family protein [Synechococcus elongatus]|uniref:FecR family protein n=1 Tax=Synechococcus elongatus TaxID=32046 RepID=UPI0030CF9194